VALLSDFLLFFHFLSLLSFSVSLIWPPEFPRAKGRSLVLERFQLLGTLETSLFPSIPSSLDFLLAGVVSKGFLGALLFFTQFPQRLRFFGTLGLFPNLSLGGSLLYGFLAKCPPPDWFPYIFLGGPHFLLGKIPPDFLFGGFSSGPALGACSNLGGLFPEFARAPSSFVLPPLFIWNPGLGGPGEFFSPGVPS